MVTYPACAAPSTVFPIRGRESVPVVDRDTFLRENRRSSWYAPAEVVEPAHDDGDARRRVLVLRGLDDRKRSRSTTSKPPSSVAAGTSSSSSCSRASASPSWRGRSARPCACSSAMPDRQASRCVPPPLPTSRRHDCRRDSRWRCRGLRPARRGGSELWRCRDHLRALSVADRSWLRDDRLGAEATRSAHPELR